MNRLELLKKAKEKVDELVAQKKFEQQEAEVDDSAREMAVQLQMNEAVIEAINEAKLDGEALAQSFRDAIAEIRIDTPQVTVPEIKIPEIKVPEAKVTVSIPEIKLPAINVPEPKVTVNVPEVKIPPFPEIKMPDSMEIHGDVGLFGYGFDNPLPVQLRDKDGNPVSLPEMISIASGGGSSRFVKINNTVSEPIPISGNITSTPGATYYASDAIGSVNIVQSIPLDVSISGATGTLATNIVDSTGVAYTGSNPLPVDITQGVNVTFGPGTIDEFGHLVTGTINNQVDIQFYRDTVANLTTVTTANGGTASATGGMATFSATAAASSRAQGVSPTTTTYTAGGEIYALFTAGWTGTGGGTSYQRIGLYNATDGFYIGREGNTFGVSIIKGGSAVQTPQANWSEDTLTGGASSLFTRDGVPEAVNLTKLNVWRIRFGWVGSAPINFEILSPDGNWVTFHRILQPNLEALPHINSADLPVTCDVNSGNSGNALTIITNCWAAGTTQALGKLDATISDDTFAQLTRSVITGETTAGGGGYVNVKVDPSGSLVTASVVSSIFGTTGTNVVNPDGRLKVELPVQSLTNTELRANSIDVQQASGASWSTNVLSMPAVTVTSITNSTAVTLLNGEGIARDTWGATQVGTWTITGITNTTATALIDSTGVQYSGSNPVPTKELRATTGTNSSVADNAASTTILASNASRLGATVYNDSSAVLYLLLGATAASTTNYTCRVASGGYYEVPFGYTGQLTGIWASDPGDGAARVTEIT